jgi:hypothetical protein
MKAKTLIYMAMAMAGALAGLGIGSVLSPLAGGSQQVPGYTASLVPAPETVAELLGPAQPVDPADDD